MKAAVITVSDSCSRGVREDLSGPALQSLLTTHGWQAQCVAVVPDEAGMIARTVSEACSSTFDLVVLTGGTGLSPRDRTPEAVRPLLDLEIPGIGEEMRRAGLEKTRRAVLSRSLAGVVRGRLVLCLPGSVKGATESLSAVLGILPHAIEILGGSSGHPDPG